MSRLSKEFFQARTCYGHLAGDLGVKITESLLSQGLIKSESGEKERFFALTPEGADWFDEHRIQLAGKRRTGKPCLDRTHKTHHVAGKLGQAIHAHMLSNGFLRNASRREVAVTCSGADFLQAAFGIRWHHCSAGRSDG